MLLSMTGYGESSAEGDTLSAAVEVRAINNRYLKINTRLSDGLAAQEAKIEKLVRQYVKRGSVQINVRLDQAGTPGGYRLNEDVLNQYREQLQVFHRHHPMDGTVSLGSLLTLPGIVDDARPRATSEETWPLIKTAAEAALHQMTEMRSAEGEAMGVDMLANITSINGQLNLIENRIPMVVEYYTTKLTDRINKMLSQFDAEVEPIDGDKHFGEDS